MYLIEDVNGLQYKVKSLAEFCKEKEITLRLIRYTNPKWKDIEGKRYQEYHKGFKIISEDIEADEVTASAETPEVDSSDAAKTTETPASDQPAEQIDNAGKVETTELPKQPKLKKKNELESSLLEAIEEHGE